MRILSILFLMFFYACGHTTTSNFIPENLEYDQNCGSALFVDKEMGEWTLVVVPDTQHYTALWKKAPFHHMQIAFDWIAAKKEDLNIKMVQGLGDITENWNNQNEWGRANEAWSRLDGKIPYMPIIGNHDDPKKFNEWFPLSKFNRSTHWGGDGGGTENNYMLMDIGTEKYLFLHVQPYTQYQKYDPKGIEWAQIVLQSHGERKVILATHDTWDTNHIRRELLQKFDNIIMSNAGHTCVREQFYETIGPNGGKSRNFITDYQCDQEEVMLLRYYVFKPKDDLVQYYTYSPVTKRFEIDESSEGSFFLVQDD